MSDIIIKPEVVEAKEKQKARDRQHERRRLAMELGAAYIQGARGLPSIPSSAFWKECLGLVDALLELTDPEEP